MTFKNLIPDFIVSNFAQKKFFDDIEGYILFIDIKGFTRITESLMKEGKSGAEIISNILDNIFAPIVEIIYFTNGFVTNFIGDAIIAIYDDTNLLGFLNSLEKIKNIIIKNKIQKTEFGEYKLSAKIGISYGNVKWRIVGLDIHKSFYFKGEAIQKSIENAKKSKNCSIIVDKISLNYIEKKANMEDSKDKIKLNVKQIQEDFYEVKNVFLYIKPENNYTEKIITYPILRIFVPEELLKYNLKGEFREIVSLFININEVEKHNKIDEIIKIVIEKVDSFGGYFNKIDFSDKGFTVVIFFGFPKTYEDNVKRAINFIIQLKKILNNSIRAGVTSGIAYCGVIGSTKRSEYTCLGDIVNLSARLMSKSKWGEITIIRSIYEKIKNDFEIKDIGLKKFKGKKDKISVFKLISEKQKKEYGKYIVAMVGRNNELQKIKSYISNLSQNKDFYFIYIYGEAGIGKSRLIYEATKEFEDHINIFYLQTESIIKKSLNPFEYFLKKYFEMDLAKDENDRKERFEKIYSNLLEKLKIINNAKSNILLKELIRTKSFIAAIIGLFFEDSPYQKLDPKGRYENTLYALKDFFIANSLIKSVLIILEDLQWIDTDSIEVFKILTRNIKDNPVGLLVTSRLNDDGSFPLLEIDKDIKYEQILLEHLNRDDCENLIDKELTIKAEKNLKDLIISKTSGNPFYIEQFCQYLLENNLLKKEDDKFILSKDKIEIPSTINSIIMARIDRLSFELKEAVQIASVIGMEFEVYILERLINELMNQAESSEIVYECEKQKIWVSLSEIKYIFKHALLQQVAYEMQLNQRLIMIHNFIGKIMEELFKNNPDRYNEIAYHYFKAHNNEKAIYYYEKSAEFYRFNFKNTEAIRCYDILLNLVGDINKKIEILNNKGYILEIIGDWEKAEKSYIDAIDYSKKINNEKLICRSKELLASLLISKGNFENAISLLNEAEEIARKIEDKRKYSFILKDYGIIYLNQGDYDKAIEYFEQMKDICLDINDKLGYSIAIENIGNVYADKGYYEKAMQYYEEKKKICLELDDKRGYSIAVGNIGLAYHYKGDLDNALKCYEERRKICFEIGDRTGYSIATGNIGNIYKDRFDFENALRCFDEIKDIFLSMGDKRRYSIAIGNIGHIYLTKGNFDEALNYFELQKEVCLFINDKRGLTTSLSYIAQVYDSKEEYDIALKYYDEAIDLAKSLNLDYHLADLLRKKAELLYEIKMFDRSYEINEQSYEISKKIQSEDYLFEATVLKFKIEKNVEKLFSLVEDAKEDEKLALIYYSIYKINNELKYKKMAKDLYNKLYENTGFYLFKKRLVELS